LAAFFLPFLLVSFLQSQSLAELAKKEKERRAALKGKPATVITTADLAKVKKRPAVEPGIPQQGEEAAAAGEAGTEGQAGVTPPVAGEGQAAAAATAEAATEAQKPATEPPAGEAGALTETEFKAKQAELMKAVQERQEMVDLLTLKLNALYQEFQNLDNMKSREFIQGQIGETYDKLLKAQADAGKAAKDLDDFNAKAKREGVPALWIK
jgi:flavin-dependent dehydrogenase